MAEVVLYHHVQGLTDGVRAFADELRATDHTVHTPDMFGGRTFPTIEDGIAFAQEQGFGKLVAGGVAPPTICRPTSSISASRSARCRRSSSPRRSQAPAARCSSMASCRTPSSATRGPRVSLVQIHAMEDDAWFGEDLPSAQALADSTDAAELFLYPGDKHLFADASTADYDAEAASVAHGTRARVPGRL